MDILPPAEPAGTNVSHGATRVEGVFEVVHNPFRNRDRPNFGACGKSTLFAHVIHRLIHSLCINRLITGDNHDCMEQAMKNSSVCKDYHNRLAGAGTVWMEVFERTLWITGRRGELCLERAGTEP